MSEKIDVSRTWIFLPAEVKSREFISRLFFAAFAVKAGYGVFVGRNGMNISRDSFPVGIYFDKCLSRHKVKFHEHQVETLGNTLVSFDEEGLMFRSEEYFLNNRISETSVDLSRLIFLWGDEQKRVLSTRLAETERLLVTGGPRLDIWRPEFSTFYQQEIDELHHKYGQFILVASNWGHCHADIDDGFDPDRSYEGHPRTFIRLAFISLIKSLGEAFPEKTVIVRPHPEDFKDYWKRQSLLFPDNVQVVYDGSVSPWIRAAQIVIHNNCTIGVEAWVSGVPLISFSPSVDGVDKWDRYTMPVNRLGVICREEFEVIDRVRDSYAGVSSPLDEMVDQWADQFLHVDRQQLATEKIIAKLSELGIQAETYEPPSYGVSRKVRAWVGDIRWRLKDLIGASGKYTYSYTMRKNSGFEMNELKGLMARLARVVDVPEEFYRIIQVDRDTFCIYGKEPDAST